MVQPEVIVPVLSFRDVHGRLDLDTTRRYAQRAAKTWIDRFLVSGSTTRGDLLTVAERAALLELWCDVAEPSRVLACAWREGDVVEADKRGLATMAVMHDLADADAALAFLAELPGGTYIYSHPMYTPAVFDAALANTARQRGVLPAGGKLAKLSLEQLRAIREAARAAFALWDGSSRHIAASMQAGASGIVATPLCTLPAPFPERYVTAMQTTVDGIQTKLDQLPTRAARTEWLMTHA